MDNAIIFDMVEEAYFGKIFEKIKTDEYGKKLFKIMQQERQRLSCESRRKNKLKGSRIDFPLKLFTEKILFYKRFA